MARKNTLIFLKIKPFRALPSRPVFCTGVKRIPHEGQNTDLGVRKWGAEENV
jgi:hypothetical protein